jgi:2-polyprenyl-3-methyl-5-hydroxy-6-metoxy-1,4-benzoquinol methylase
MSLKYYKENATSYKEKTISLNMMNVYKKVLPFIKENGTVLDVGAGSGRDTKYFTNNGYKVYAMDGCPEFIEECKKTIGERAVCSTYDDFQTDLSFDLIWSMAAFVHLDKNDLYKNIKKFSSLLNTNGIFYISLKNSNEIFSDHKDRKFYVHTSEEIKNYLNKIKDLKLIDHFVTGDIMKRNNSWNNFVIKKTKTLKKS